MKIVFVFLIFIFTISTAFDVDSFLKKFCKISTECLNYIRTEDVLCCENVAFSKEEFLEIQENDFQISSAESVFFGKGDLGTVNGNFFSKFPNATEMTFANTKISLKNKDGAFTNSQLRKLNFYECELSDNLNSNSLHALEDLESLVLIGNEMEFKIIDSTFLKRNKNIKHLMIIFNKDQQTLSKDAFKNLWNLESLIIYNMKENLPSNLIKNNTNLNYLILASSLFTKVPENIPSSVEVLNLSANKIKHVSRRDFQNIGNLKELRIIFNGLETIDEDSFDDLVKLEKLSLGINNLTTLTPRHFENCLSLKWINLASNELMPMEVIEDLRRNSTFDIILDKI